MFSFIPDINNIKADRAINAIKHNLKSILKEVENIFVKNKFWFPIVTGFKFANPQIYAANWLITTNIFIFEIEPEIPNSYT